MASCRVLVSPRWRNGDIGIWWYRFIRNCKDIQSNWLRVLCMPFMPFSSLVPFMALAAGNTLQFPSMVWIELFRCIQESFLIRSLARSLTRPPFHSPSLASTLFLPLRLERHSVGAVCASNMYYIHNQCIIVVKCMEHLVPCVRLMCIVYADDDMTHQESGKRVRAYRCVCLHE